jgi:hypothetical protein
MPWALTIQIANNQPPWLIMEIIPSLPLRAGCDMVDSSLNRILLIEPDALAGETP